MLFITSLSPPISGVYRPGWAQCKENQQIRVKSWHEAIMTRVRLWKHRVGGD